MSILAFVQKKRETNQLAARAEYWRAVSIVAAKPEPTDADAEKLLTLASASGIPVEEIDQHLAAAQSAIAAAAFIKANSQSEPAYAAAGAKAAAYAAETEKIIWDRTAQKEVLYTEALLLNNICMQIKSARDRIAYFQAIQADTNS